MFLMVYKMEDKYHSIVLKHIFTKQHTKENFTTEH